MTIRRTALVVDNGQARTVEFTDDTSYEVIQRALNGGWLEGIGGDGWFAYVDEEGKMKGLPYNHAATVLAHAIGWPEGDVLVGPAVFVGPANSEGYDTGVRQWVTDTAIVLGIEVR